MLMKSEVKLFWEVVGLRTLQGKERYWSTAV